MLIILKNAPNAFVLLVACLSLSFPSGFWHWVCVAGWWLMPLSAKRAVTSHKARSRPYRCAMSVRSTSRMPTNWKETLTRLSNIASLLCVLDCTILPIVTVLLPLFGMAAPGHLEWLHQLGKESSHGASLVLVISLISWFVFILTRHLCVGHLGCKVAMYFVIPGTCLV